jgi:vacuolar-type H+-ATPase subunit D/Vma8
MKARLAGAHKGHGLLKKKADALQMRFRLILGKIIEVSSIVTRSRSIERIVYFFLSFRQSN